MQVAAVPSFDTASHVVTSPAFCGSVAVQSSRMSVAVHVTVAAPDTGLHSVTKAATAVV